MQACKKLLETFGRGPGPTADPVVIHSVFDLARHLHDAVDSLSIEDERRQASRLICRFIEKVLPLRRSAVRELCADGDAAHWHACRWTLGGTWSSS